MTTLLSHTYQRFKCSHCSLCSPLSQSVFLSVNRPFNLSICLPFYHSVDSMWSVRVAGVSEGWHFFNGLKCIESVSLKNGLVWWCFLCWLFYFCSWFFFKFSSSSFPVQDSVLFSLPPSPFLWFTAEADEGVRRPFFQPFCVLVGILLWQLSWKNSEDTVFSLLFSSSVDIASSSVSLYNVVSCSCCLQKSGRIWEAHLGALPSRRAFFPHPQREWPKWLIVLQHLRSLTVFFSAPHSCMCWTGSSCHLWSPLRPFFFFLIKFQQWPDVMPSPVWGI